MYIIKNHFLEIKYKFYYYLFSFFLTSFTIYIYNFEILEKIFFSLHNNEYDDKTLFIYFSNFYETFEIYFYLNLLIAFHLLIPYIFFNIWIFLIPGISKLNKNMYFKKIILYFLFFLIINITFYFKLFPFIISTILENNYTNNNDNDLQFSIQIEIITYLSTIWKIIYIYNFILFIPYIQIYLIKNLKWIKYKKYLYIIILFIILIFAPIDYTYIFSFWIPVLILLEYTHFLQILKNNYNNIK